MKECAGRDRAEGAATDKRSVRRIGDAADFVKLVRWESKDGALFVDTSQGIQPGLGYVLRWGLLGQTCRSDDLVLW